MKLLQINLLLSNICYIYKIGSSILVFFLFLGNYIIFDELSQN